MRASLAIYSCPIQRLIVNPKLIWHCNLPEVESLDLVCLCFDCPILCEQSQMCIREEALLIYETKSLEIGYAERAHIDRSDEGHVKIIPKVRTRNRSEWSLEIAIELVKVTMTAREPWSWDCGSVESTSGGSTTRRMATGVYVDRMDCIFMSTHTFKRNPP